ncbi:hypothetical protein ACA910_015583 [Epithemia clementina (nom. ined.)]
MDLFLFSLHNATDGPNHGTPMHNVPNSSYNPYYAWILVHDDEESVKTRARQTALDHNHVSSSVLDPMIGCDTVKVFVAIERTKRNDDKIIRKEDLGVQGESSCVVLVAQPTPDTPQVFHDSTRSVERRRDSVSHVPPSSSSLDVGDIQSAAFLENDRIRTELHHYLSIFPTALMELHTVIQQPPKRQTATTTATLMQEGREGGRHASSHSNFQTIILLTIVGHGNDGDNDDAKQEQIIQQRWKQFLCFARDQEGLEDFSKLLVLVVTVDGDTAGPDWLGKQRPSHMEIRSFGSANHLISSAISNSEQRLVLSQIYVSQMILHLGYNLLVWDITTKDPLFPSSSAALDGFVKDQDQSNKVMEDLDDLYFSPLQSEPVEAMKINPSLKLTTPWMIDTSMFFVKSNVRTKYLWSKMITSVDRYLLTTLREEEEEEDGKDKTTQTRRAKTTTKAQAAVAAILSELTWDSTSMFGLRPRLVATPTDFLSFALAVSSKEHINQKNRKGHAASEKLLLDNMDCA